MASIQRLRQELKQTRAKMPLAERRKNNQRLRQHILSSPYFLKARRLAAFIPFGGEPDLLPLLKQATRLGKQCFLPRIDPILGGMQFRAFQPGDQLARNRYGIPEPRLEQTLSPASTLDLMLMPLLGFDSEGNRLGMGAGFYDRYLAYRRQRRHWQGPVLAGVAWSVQQRASIPARSWDVPLDMIVTENGWHDFRARPHRNRSTQNRLQP